MYNCISRAAISIFFVKQLIDRKAIGFLQKVISNNVKLNSI